MLPCSQLGNFETMLFGSVASPASFSIDRSKKLIFEAEAANSAGVARCGKTEKRGFDESFSTCWS
jgi:hypothetical protein